MFSLSKIKNIQKAIFLTNQNFKCANSVSNINFFFVEVRILVPQFMIRSLSISLVIEVN